MADPRSLARSRPLTATAVAVRLVALTAVSPPRTTEKNSLPDLKAQLVRWYWRRALEPPKRPVW
jgi:hypothetical protein